MNRKMDCHPGKVAKPKPLQGRAGQGCMVVLPLHVSEYLWHVSPYSTQRYTVRPEHRQADRRTDMPRQKTNRPTSRPRLTVQTNDRVHSIPARQKQETNKNNSSRRN